MLKGKREERLFFYELLKEEGVAHCSLRKKEGQDKKKEKGPCK